MLFARAYIQETQDISCFYSALLECGPLKELAFTTETKTVE
jgi:hypothetical protein